MQKKFDSIVICSTLNQMTNYLIIKHHDIHKIYNLTLSNKVTQDNPINKKFSYEMWDKNLEKVLGNGYNIENIDFDIQNIKEHKNIVKKLEGKEEKLEEGNKLAQEKSILWNITGGQRYFMMAMIEYICNYRGNTDDELVYFDGDTNELHYYKIKLGDDGIGFDISNSHNKCVVENEEITIPMALKLMGFTTEGKSLNEKSPYYKYIQCNNKEEFMKYYDDNKCNKTLQTYHKIKKTKNKTEEIYNKIEKSFEVYNALNVLYKNEKVIRNVLIASNRFKKMKENTLDQIRNELQEQMNYIGEKKNLEDFIDKHWGILSEDLDSYTNSKTFGYIFERMILYKIIKYYKENKRKFDKIADISYDISSYQDTSVKEDNIDQFDLLILIKSGKMVMLECKSGSMGGDNAKSHNYSTYAISGVYGTPTIICPINKSDRSEEFHLKYSSVDKKDTTVDNKKIEDINKYIISARKSAERANLQVMSIDEIESQLLDKLK